MAVLDCDLGQVLFYYKPYRPPVPPADLEGLRRINAENAYLNSGDWHGLTGERRSDIRAASTAGP